MSRRWKTRRLDLLRRAVGEILEVPGRDALPACELRRVPIYRPTDGQVVSSGWVASWRVVPPDAGDLRQARTVTASWTPGAMVAVLAYGGIGGSGIWAWSVSDDLPRVLGGALRWIRNGNPDELRREGLI